MLRWKKKRISLAKSLPEGMMYKCLSRMLLSLHQEIQTLIGAKIKDNVDLKGRAEMEVKKSRKILQTIIKTKYE